MEDWLDETKGLIELLRESREIFRKEGTYS
jgi:hypothetical protein